MILNTTHIEQTIDRDRRGRFIKELVLVRIEGAQDPGPVRGEAGVPLAMVRKRRADAQGTLAPVVLIHGYGQNRYAFHLPSRSLSCYLAQAGYDVFTVELRGHGRSRHLGAHPPAHVSHFVREDLPTAIAEVKRLSGGRPVFLVGHSLGGLIAYAAVTQLRSDIAGVVTLGSPYQFTRGSKTLAWIGAAMLALDRRVPLGHGGLELKPVAELMRVARGIIESPLVPLPIRGFAPRSMEPQVLSQHMALAMDTGSITVLRNMFLSAAESRKSGHRLGGLRGYAAAFEASDVPLLIIAGTKDDLAPPASVEPAFRRSRSTDKTYRTFPRGHIDLLVGREAPLTVWPLIESWMGARLRRARQTA